MLLDDRRDPPGTAQQAPRVERDTMTTRPRGIGEADAVLVTVASPMTRRPAASTSSSSAAPAPARGRHPGWRPTVEPSSRTSTHRPGVLPKLPYQMHVTWARCTVSMRPYRYTAVLCQTAAVARAAGRPSLRPFNALHPRRPVRGGAVSNKQALAGSRVVHVVPGTSSGLPW